MTFNHFLRESSLAVEPYWKKNYTGLLNLSSNELLHPALNKLFASYQVQLGPEQTWKYPDLDSPLPILSDMYSLNADQIVLAPGGDQAIRTIMQAFGRSCGRIILQWPNYINYLRYGNLEELAIEQVDFAGKHYKTHFEEFKTTLQLSMPALVVISNPNGFTGEVFSLDEITTLLDVCRLKGHLLLVDEAYHTFSEIDHSGLLHDKDAPLILLRTFSKSFGLAGARAAAVLTNPLLITHLRRWNVSSGLSGTTVHYLIHAVKHKSVFSQIWEDVKVARTLLGNALLKRFPHWQVHPSQGNFILIKTKSADEADAFIAFMLRHDIVIRKFNDAPALSDCFRVSLGEISLLQPVLDAIDNHCPRQVTIVGGGTLKKGSVKVTGHKHSLVPILALSANLGRLVQLSNVPEIEDSRVMTKILQQMGISVSFQKGTINIEPSHFNDHTLPENLSQRIHGAQYLIPIILGQTGKVKFKSLGGCQIGNASEAGGRPIHHVLKILEHFGAVVENQDSEIEITAHQFKPCTIDVMAYSERTDILTGPLVSGATKTAILAACMVHEGTSVIKNPYLKPDVTELVEFITQAGYLVDFCPAEISITPGCNPVKNQVQYSIMPDVSEVMTWICIAAYLDAAIDILISQETYFKVKEGLKAEWDYLSKMGITLMYDGKALHVSVPDKIKGVDIEVTSRSIYSDHQPFFALLLLKAGESSEITEYVWKDRFEYARELKKLGAQITFEEKGIKICPSVLDQKGKLLEAKDLRSAAALIIAALGVGGETSIQGTQHLVRGYEGLEKQLILLGANLNESSILTPDNS